MRELRSVTNLAPNEGIKRESSEMSTYVSSLQGLRQRTLTLIWGAQRKIRKLCGGQETRTHTSDHESHHQSCQRHNGMRDWSPGERNHEWLASTQLPSTSNSIDFDSIGQ